tara:strand:+ start:360 stop:659 length:300 start_codon:yes stop_codon:yes gene_type:complete
MQRNNRNVEFKERPKPAVGNNKHLRNIGYITECIIQKGGRASTSEIYDWMNSNTRNGIGMRQLPQVLYMGPFVQYGQERVKHALSSSSYEVFVWGIKEE